MVLEQAATHGDAPYFICMDANVDISKSNVLQLAMQAGEWHNVLHIAGTSGDCNAPTYGKCKAWDKHKWQTHTPNADVAKQLESVEAISFEARVPFKFPMLTIRPMEVRTFLATFE